MTQREAGVPATSGKQREKCQAVLWGWEVSWGNGKDKKGNSEGVTRDKNKGLAELIGCIKLKQSFAFSLRCRTLRGFYDKPNKLLKHILALVPVESGFS